MPSKKIRIAILASGNGSNAEAIINHFKNHPDIGVAILLSNNPNAYALERATRLGIPTRTFSKEQFQDPRFFQQLLNEYRVTHLVLAGFLWLIPHYLIKAYPDKIINIHPSLLPRFGGKGMYGLKVHEAVKASGEKETGITIHIVNENYDEGKILFQGKCSVEDHHTPQEIAQCVQQLEYEHYPKVIEAWVSAKP